eukprot:6303502-Amphidinium_carterae.1
MSVIRRSIGVVDEVGCASMVSTPCVSHQRPPPHRSSCSFKRLGGIVLVGMALTLLQVSSWDGTV